MSERVLAYVTHGSDLLVLRHPDHPEVGVQVPGGSIELGESPIDAARREVFEETGLSGLRPRGIVGTTEWDMQPFSKGVQRRTFVHLSLEGPRRERWQHLERHGGHRGQPVLFELTWEALDGSDLGLVAGHGARLGTLMGAGALSQRRRGVEELRAPILEWRRTRGERVAAALAKLAGSEMPNPIADGTESAGFAAVDHALSYLRRSAQREDAATTAAVLAAWRSLVPTRGVAVFSASECEPFNDPNFDSPLYLVPLAHFSERIERTSGVIREALRLLQQSGWAGLLDDTLGIIITLSERGPAEETESYTLSALRGTVAVDVPSEPVRMAELLLHEAAHVWLNDACEALGEALPFSNTVYPSLWKNKQRPAYGILHAAWAFSHLIRWFSAFVVRGTTSYEAVYCAERLRVESSTLKEALPEVREVVAQVSSPVLRGAILTEVNEAIQLSGGRKSTDVG